MRPCARRVRVLCGCDSPPIHVSLIWMYGCVDVAVGECAAQIVCGRWTLVVSLALCCWRKMCRTAELMWALACALAPLQCGVRRSVVALPLVDWQFGGRAVENWDPHVIVSCEKELASPRWLVTADWAKVGRRKEVSQSADCEAQRRSAACGDVVTS